MMLNKKILSMMSLCQRAGKLVSGELGCEKSLQGGTSYIIIIAGDASENTKNKFINKSEFYNIPSVVFSTKEELSHAIGKNNRSVFSVVDYNFYKKIEDLYFQMIQK